ncbi:hypothetical protein CesoFtcFv8_017410 [Champsocephalus esox]|uniref:Uncharacterized protein n=1 Tax=Champsocephalus esox TaxID=159716 RepID=A0AAN8BJF0_9TELE|nr:hypothetical protein CesoFtcFv8_017410 [Champsocephalus esox]
MQMPKDYYVVPAEAPEHHPSTLNIINSDVFYSFEEAYQVLEKCGDIIPEARDCAGAAAQPRGGQTETRLPCYCHRRLGCHR